MVVQNGSTASGANVYQHTYNNTASDQWYLEPEVVEGRYRIKNKSTGKYLTSTNYNYLRLLDGNSTNKEQIFYITPSSNGYYDIAPAYNRDYSITVSGCFMDYDEENAYVNTSYGQSHSGQRWRFILNGDGSYRMMSELSGLTKAITCMPTDPTYVHSTTYAVNNNANWVLEKVDPSEYAAESSGSLEDRLQQYQLEGEHVIVDLDPATYFIVEENGVEKTIITPENLKRWIAHLDQAYVEYEELVGSVPQNGEKLRIVPVGSNMTINGKTGTYTMFSMPGCKVISWRKDLIIADLAYINKYDDWSFGMLHEMSHVFDYDSDWYFDIEFSANFKMACILREFDGQFKVTPKTELGLLTSYSALKEYYEKNATDSYVKTMGLATPVYHIDGLTYMFLNKLDETNSWGALPDTYKEIHDKNLTASKDYGKFNVFVTTLDEKSDYVFWNSFFEDYEKQLLTIKAKLDK